MKTYKVEIDSDGTIRYYKEGTNILHREDGPAIEWTDGDKEWYLNGERHREDGPACEWVDGSREWFFDGEFHREDGPAVERADGDKFWYLNDKRHREDGPACEYSNGDKFWFLNGIRLSEEEVNTCMNKKSCAGKVITVEGKQYTLTEI